MLTFMALISFCVGGPVHPNIFYSWLIVDVPWKSGLPRTTSPIMHPRLQISIYLEYEWHPSNNSGARYHLVAI